MAALHDYERALYTVSQFKTKPLLKLKPQQPLYKNIKIPRELFHQSGSIFTQPCTSNIYHNVINKSSSCILPRDLGTIHNNNSQPKCQTIILDFYTLSPSVNDCDVCGYSNDCSMFICEVYDVIPTERAQYHKLCRFCILYHNVTILQVIAQFQL